MNPKQKRSIGLILVAFGLTLMAGDVGFMIYCIKTGLKVSPGIGMMLLVCFMPLWVIGTILISQAKKEEDAK